MQNSRSILKPMARKICDKTLQNTIETAIYLILFVVLFYSTLWQLTEAIR